MNNKLESDFESESSDELIDNISNIDLKNSVLKNYNILYELGKGSYSTVWLVYNIFKKKFYAMKVQSSDYFQTGLDEIKFVQKLPKEPSIFNNLIEYFIVNLNNKKYLCSIWNLHCCNLDTILRKCNFTNGLPLITVKKIMKQLITALMILHKKFKVYHGDIKTDNILVKGINNRDKFISDLYINLLSSYQDNLNNRSDNHNKIMSVLCESLNKYENANLLDNNYIDNITISLADFGTYCHENYCYSGTFGTRYYQAPEIILLGKCSYEVDIWALGCTFYELLSGQILFNPIKDSNYSRDYYHLCLINQTCGIFPYKFIRNTKRYSEFFLSNKLKYYNNDDTGRLLRKIDSINISDVDKQSVFEILSAILQINPKKRCSLDWLNEHKFFIL